MGLVNGDVDEFAAGAGYVRSDRRIARTAAPLEDTGRGENLGTVTDRRNGFAGLGKVPHDLNDPLVEPDVLGCPTPGNNQGVICFF